jgi:methanesulfonate monooxygenase large subunit
MARVAVNFFKNPEAPDTHFVDNRIYTDEDIFREEQQKIFAKVWKFVCHDSELRNPHDYRTTTVAGTPLIVVRGKDNKIRTFVNACSHRGALIVRTPSGNARTMECVFHRWTYDSTTGECTGRPNDAAFNEAGPKIEDCALREIKTEVYLGLVFVTLDDGAVGLSEFLGDALELQKGVLETGELEVFDFYEQVLSTNWKNWQETNMDLYHEFMHLINRRTGLSEPSYYQRNWRIYSHGHAAIERYRVRYDKQKGWTERSPHLRLPSLDAADFQLNNLFPDIAINARGTVMRIDSQIPLSSTQTLVQYRGLAKKVSSEADRVQQRKDYSIICGPFGRNMPEDCIATELQGIAMRGEQIPFTFWSREDRGKTQDDMALRAYYKEWGRLMGRSPAHPVNIPPGY